MKHAARPFRRVRLPLSERAFRRLWFALLTSDFGDAIGRIALVILVFQETGSGLAAALVPALSVLPFLGLGQIVTSFVDRWPRRRVLVVADLIRAAAFGLMALPIGTPGRLALLTVASAVEPPFLAVRRAITPSTLPEHHFGDGIRLLSATTEVALLTGAAAGGLLTAAWGPATVMALNAATFAVSALALQGLPLRRVEAPATTGERLRAGWQAMTGDRIVRHVWLWFPALSATALGMEALITPFVFDELERGEVVVGVLAGVVSVGVLLAAALLPRRTEHVGLVHQMGFVAALGSAIVLGFLLLPPTLPFAIVAFVGVGAIYSARIPSQILYGERIDESARAASASLADGAYAVAQIVGSLGAGALVDAAGARPAAITIAALGVTGGLWVRLRPALAGSADGAYVEADARGP